MIKVSVVVATYNSGPRLDRTIDSLVGQSLPAAEFEAIFVDDGSTDDTFERLQRVTARHRHFEAMQIPNSGWSGRPRNLGTDRARGTYLLYLDHDDLLFPEALQRMSDYGDSTGADVVLGKEAMVGDPLTPGWPTWKQNVASAGVDQTVLHCVTPHKLYRRSLLTEAKIKFPEGPVRLEDQYFNAAVYAATDKIAILADYPCYQWVIHEDNLHRAGFDFDVFLDSFYRSLEPIQALPDSPKRRELLKRWYVRVILRWLGPGDHPIRDRYLADADRILSHFPVEMDTDLEPIDRIRSWLFRRRDQAGLDAVREFDRTVRIGIDPVRSADWASGELRVGISGLLMAGDRPYPIAAADGRLSIDLSGLELADLPPAAMTRIDDRLDAAVVDLGLRGRKSGVEWPMPDPAKLIFDPDRPDGGALTFRIDARITLREGPLRLRVAEEIFDARLHLTGLGYERIDPVKAEDPLRQAQDDASTGSGRGLTPRPALVDGFPAVAYPTNDGRLALDLTRLGEARRLLQLAEVDPAVSTVRTDDDRPELRLALTGLHTAGDSTLDGTLAYEHSSPAILTGDSEGARVRFTADRGDAFAIRSRFQDRWIPTGAELAQTGDGSLVRGRQEPAPMARTAVNASAASSRSMRTEEVTVDWKSGRLAVTVRGTIDRAVESIGLIVRGRATGVEVPVETRPVDAQPASFQVAGEIDPAGLTEDIWDVRLKATSPEERLQDPVLIGKLTERPALVDGRGMVAYATKGGGLALDLTETARTVVGAARIDPGDVTDTDAPGECVITLPRVHVHGTSELRGRAVTEIQTPARLIGSDTGAAIIAEAPIGTARRDLRFAFSGHRSSRRVALEFGDDTVSVLVSGQPATTLTPAPVTDGTPAADGPGIGSKLRRGLSGMLRRRDIGRGRGVGNSS